MEGEASERGLKPEKKDVKEKAILRNLRFGLGLSRCLGGFPVLRRDLYRRGLLSPSRKPLQKILRAPLQEPPHDV